jgi:hypothetical protein
MEFLYNNKGKCEIDSSTKIPVMDNNYFDNHSIYEKCKCINKLKENLEILVVKEPAKYNAYLDIYKNKYLENKCEEVFKNYVKTNSQEIYASVTQEDKARIEADSIKQRNTRLYIGASVLFVVIGMIAIYGTRKN